MSNYGRYNHGDLEKGLFRRKARTSPRSCRSLCSSLRIIKSRDTLSHSLCVMGATKRNKRPQHPAPLIYRRPAFLPSFRLKRTHKQAMRSLNTVWRTTGVQENGRNTLGGATFLTAQQKSNDFVLLFIKNG